MTSTHEGPSAAARALAAYRRTCLRLGTSYGNPSGDERLADDVINGTTTGTHDRVARYLQARTSFFDRVVVKAIDRDVRQLVNVGAGYDGRAIRYATAGVRWFEIDRPETQRDKRARLARLGIDAPDITFVEAHLGETDLASALLGHGYEPEVPAQVWCEGVAVHLDPDALGAALDGLRDLATVGTRLAISVSPVSDPAGPATRRRRSGEVPAALEVPGRTFEPDEAEATLAAHRWREVEFSERARRVGFLVSVPLWAPRPTTGPDGTRPARPAVPASRAGAYMERLYHRAGTDHLASHLEHRHGIGVDRLAPLDVGVFRVLRTDGPDWIARVFPADRPVELVEGDAAILDALARDGFPAERNARPDPVSVLDGQGVLVTDLVVGRRAKSDRRTLRALGSLLGRLHAESGPWAGTQRAGGAWHHLAFDGGPREEIDAAVELLRAAEPRIARDEATLYAGLCDGIAGLDDGRGLPEAFSHPDFVAANALVSDESELTMVDWAGAGRAPRVVSLAFLLWAAGARDPRAAGAVISGYAAHVRPEPDELRRLPGLVAARPLVLESWAFCTGRQSITETAAALPAIRERAREIATRAVGALAP